MFDLFIKTAHAYSKDITQTYSTSFSLGIKTLSKRFHPPIYGIYGMVRIADEIVDTFHDFDKKYLLNKFKQDTFEAIETGISLNPVLFSFQKVVSDYNIPLELIAAFFTSMEMDLYETTYEVNQYEAYIYGSAEVVGLMCLKVFTEGNNELYEQLKAPAKSLGAAFQKINFLRDIKSDFDERGRIYFPGIDLSNFGEDAKRQIEQDVEQDFRKAYQGILQLPISSRAGVLLSYKYYLLLFKKIRRVPVSKIASTRIRVPNFQKLSLLFTTIMRHQFATFSIGH